MTIGGLIGGALGTMVDPINLAVAIITGVVCKHWWLAILLSCGWQCVFRLMSGNLAEMRLLLPGLVGTTVVTILVWTIASYRRRKKAASELS